MSSRSYIVLDTETTTYLGRKRGVYDLGYLICDCKTHEIKQARSLCIQDVFSDSSMENAYYKEKVPIYLRGLTHEAKSVSEWTYIRFKTALELLKADCEAHDVRTLWAYNVKFDLGALADTLWYLSNGLADSLPQWLKDLKVRDIWDEAQIVTQTPKFVEWCLRNQYLTEKGNPKTSAEIVYRYLEGRNDFEEAHTACADCVIEHRILKAVMRRHGRSAKTIGRGWIGARDTLTKMLAAKDAA